MRFVYKYVNIEIQIKFEYKYVSREIQIRFVYKYRNEKYKCVLCTNMKI